MIALSLDCLNKLVHDEVDSMKLSKLLQSDTNLRVDDIFLSLSWLLTCHSSSNQLNQIAQRLQKNISQFFKSPRFISCKLNIAQLLKPSNIFNTIREFFAFSEVIKIAFKDVKGSLEIHYSILSFMSIICCIFIHQLRYARKVRCSMTTHRSSQNFNTILTNLAEKTFTEGQVRMVFFK